MTANFIQLTLRVNNKSVPVYVNVDQICGVRDPVGGGSGYSANIMLASGALERERKRRRGHAEDQSTGLGRRGARAALGEEVALCRPQKEWSPWPVR